LTPLLVKVIFARISTSRSRRPRVQGGPYGWPPDAKFLIPNGVREHFQAGIGARGLELHRAWWAQFEEYRRQYPEPADQGYRMLRRELPDRWDEGFPSFSTDRKGLATRDASGQALNVLARHVSWLLGGSADLGPSCKTRLTFGGAGDFSAQNPAGRNLHFGIREHAMGAILNGLSLSRCAYYRFSAIGVGGPGAKRFRESQGLCRSRRLVSPWHPHRVARRPFKSIVRLCPMAWGPSPSRGRLSCKEWCAGYVRSNLRVRAVCL
jgi:hypothetical protein